MAEDLGLKIQLVLQKLSSLESMVEGVLQKFNVLESSVKTIEREIATLSEKNQRSWEVSGRNGRYLEVSKQQDRGTEFNSWQKWERD